MKSTNVQDLSFELLKERLQSVVDRLDQAGFSIMCIWLFLTLLYIIWISSSAESMRKLNWHRSLLKWNQISSEIILAQQIFFWYLSQVWGEEQLEQLGCNHGGRWIGGPHVMTWLHFSLWSRWHNVTSTLLTSRDQSRVDGAARGLPRSYYHHKASQ